MPTIPTISAIPGILVTAVTTVAQVQEFCALAPALSPVQYGQGQVNLHLIAYRDGHAVARCSLWWSSVPRLTDQRVGCIGHYSANDRAAAAELLATAIVHLEAAGCTFAVGPLDGSTFRNYRLVTQRSFRDEVIHPPFLLEPDNPDQWPDDFRAAGFLDWSEYLSDLAPLVGPDPKLEARKEALAAQGVHLRALDPEVFGNSPTAAAAFERELAHLYPLVMTAFAKSPLFTPLADAEFVAQYRPVRALLVPELVTLAERDGEMVGFLFALPDYTQAQRGEAVNTVILKTLAVLPTLASIGLGSLLAAQIHTQAYLLGYRWAIHALMHVDNRSRRISAHTAQPFRGYTLFARTLKPSDTSRKE